MELQKPKRQPTNQELIVRQSCLRTAVDYCNNQKREDILKIAEDLEKWCWRTI